MKLAPMMMMLLQWANAADELHGEIKQKEMELKAWKQKPYSADYPENTRNRTKAIKALKDELTAIQSQGVEIPDPSGPTGVSARASAVSSSSTGSSSDGTWHFPWTTASPLDGLPRAIKQDDIWDLCDASFGLVMDRQKALEKLVLEQEAKIEKLQEERMDYQTVHAVAVHFPAEPDIAELIWDFARPSKPCDEDGCPFKQKYIDNRWCPLDPAPYDYESCPECRGVGVESRTCSLCYGKGSFINMGCECDPNDQAARCEKCTCHGCAGKGVILPGSSESSEDGSSESSEDH